MLAISINNTHFNHPSALKGRGKGPWVLFRRFKENRFEHSQEVCQDLCVSDFLRNIYYSDTNLRRQSRIPRSGTEPHSVEPHETYWREASLYSREVCISTHRSDPCWHERQRCRRLYKTPFEEQVETFQEHVVWERSQLNLKHFDIWELLFKWECWFKHHFPIFPRYAFAFGANRVERGVWWLGRFVNIVMLFFFLRHCWIFMSKSSHDYNGDSF